MADWYFPAWFELLNVDMNNASQGEPFKTSQLLQRISLEFRCSYIRFQPKGMHTDAMAIHCNPISIQA